MQGTFSLSGTWLRQMSILPSMVFRRVLHWAITINTGDTLWDGMTRSGLLGVRGVQTDEGNNAYWLVVHSYFNGYETVSTPYDLIVEDYSFEDIGLKAGHVLHLVYIEDQDGDGIYSREEFLSGTGDGTLDSDGDGITDDDEIENGSDPGNPDTDYDGLNDLSDPDPLLPNQFMMTGGWESTILLKADGSLWGCGTNHWGELGLGDIDYFTTLEQIGTGSDWSQVAFGSVHSLAGRKDGTIWGTGQNQFGQLGVGDNDHRNELTQTGGDWDWVKITAGPAYLLAIKENGTLWAWGFNDYGQLGDGTKIEKNVPTLIGSIEDIWLDVSAKGHTLAIKSDGTLWSWGRNMYGQLGLGDMGDGTDRTVPTQVGSDNGWVSVAAGLSHSLALREDGTLWAWGQNQHGQLGLGTNDSQNIPTQVGNDNYWVFIAAGNWHSLAIKEDGSV
jgi:alpha-tubulin suppressor-like RCC1 family protein